MNHPDETRLHDLVDDALSEEARARVTAHVGNCASCRALVAGIRALKADAAVLARDAVPDPAAWGKIEERIRGEPAQVSGHAPHVPTQAERAIRGPSRRGVLRAATLALLIGLTSGTAYLLTRTGATADGRNGFGISTSGSPTTPGNVAATAEAPAPTLRAAWTIAEAYAPALSELEQVLDQAGERLQPETVRVLEENLWIIDDAIREVVEALEADPGHPGTIRALNGMYETKVRVLWQAVRHARDA